MSVFIFWGELLDHMAVLVSIVKGASILVSRVNSDTDNRIVVARGEGGGWGEANWAKGPYTRSQEETRLWEVSTQWSTQVGNYEVVHLKFT